MSDMEDVKTKCDETSASPVTSKREEEKDKFVNEMRHKTTRSQFSFFITILFQHPIDS